jgi:hypothetical protein
MTSKPKRDLSSSQPPSALKNKESVPRLSKVRFADSVKKGTSFESPPPEKEEKEEGKISRLTNCLDFN